MAPGCNPAVREARGETVEIGGPVERLLDVLLARPDDLDRTVDLLRDAHGLGDVIDLEPPAEPAADHMIVDDDLVQRRPVTWAAIACARARI